MVSFFSQWYKQKFSDPNAVTLVVILLMAFLAIYFLSSLLMPVFVAIAIAFLLDLPVNRLGNFGLSRRFSTVIIVVAFVGVALLGFLGLMPVIWQQSSNLIQEVPQMLSQGQTYLLTLPEQYPEYIKAEQIQSVITLVNDKLIEWGQVALKASLNSISDIVALLIYLILVPLMVFFFLKDKKELLAGFSQFLPKDRKMASQVSDEMNQQIMNYIRGKVIEILIIGTASTVAFVILGLNYAVLLGVLVGLSVLVPYVGATIVTFPVLLVALFQWGVGAEFGYVMLAYGIIQALDGNLLVPLLFSEAVNLHPVTIIIAVILFGGLWGFWGVFFAIPLATLVKAVLNAWPSSTMSAEASNPK
ncbi:AI-2E family transporter [Thalassotalea castellviae]|uniref:AI-2E family transporter n=1 Tax=Thalassotalea castellviae TaxID=3075612 RepID=A0ABU2ZWC0_9GAMM|nr:AI-2E family transporter [Thalassotalea sp. W431]MDT0602227.1 AI-2E family transporter [Thalassotalea sp. W431]